MVRVWCCPSAYGVKRGYGEIEGYYEEKPVLSQRRSRKHEMCRCRSHVGGGGAERRRGKSSEAIQLDRIMLQGPVREQLNLFYQFRNCHSRESGNPAACLIREGRYLRVPACAGMTLSGGFNNKS